MNKVNQLARECMVTALIRLSKKKPLSSISISELTKCAGVSRMTYYRNYSSKEEILSSYLDEIVEKYKKELARRKISHQFAGYENILECFVYFKKYKDFLQCIFRVGMGNLLLSALTNYMTESYYSGKNEEQYYMLQAYAGALFNVFMAWLQKEMREPIENLARMLSRLYQKESVFFA